MKILTDKINLSRLRKVAAFLVLGGVVAVSTATPAKADWHDRGWDHHAAWAHRDWHRGPPPAHVVYAPPVVYSPPPPVSPGLSLVLPINFH